MKKEISEILTIDGKKVYRVTCPDERWYGKEARNPVTGLPEIVWLPSVTWIASYYYTSPYLVRWIASQGMTEAERIKKEAGLKGDKIHQATEQIDKTGEIKITDKFLNKETGEMEELNMDELLAVQSYQNFVDKVKPELLANEMVVFGENYAGVLDRIFRIGDQVYIVDLKSGQSIYINYIIQLSAYSHAQIDYEKLGITKKEWENRKLAILRLGYLRNEERFKFTEVNDRFDLFEIAYKVWKEENPDAKPKQYEFPLAIVSEWQKKQIEEALKKVKKKSKKI